MGGGTGLPAGAAGTTHTQRRRLAARPRAPPYGRAPPPDVSALSRPRPPSSPHPLVLARARALVHALSLFLLFRGPFECKEEGCPDGGSVSCEQMVGMLSPKVCLSTFNDLYDNLPEGLRRTAKVAEACRVSCNSCAELDTKDEL